MHNYVFYGIFKKAMEIRVVVRFLMSISLLAGLSGFLTDHQGRP